METSVTKNPRPIIIKLFESENVLKCKNHYHDLIETLFVCLFFQIIEKILKGALQWSYHDIINLLLSFYIKENYMTKSLRIFSSFTTMGPDAQPYIDIFKQSIEMFHK